MKKQSNLSRLHAAKLSLNKKTISNLNASEMNGKVGGRTYWNNQCHTVYNCGGFNYTKSCTQNQNTCQGHNTCYTC